ncbi:MAG: hypothetical protein AAGJ10_17360 [Bacteroidota bacterium]
MTDSRIRILTIVLACFAVWGFEAATGYHYNPLNAPFDIQALGVDLAIFMAAYFVVHFVLKLLIGTKSEAVQAS